MIDYSLPLRGNRLGLGCWAIGGPFWANEQPLGWGQVDDETSVRSIRTAVDRGISLFDTADVYGAGHSERILGRTLGKDRKNVLIATKWGNVFDENSLQLTGIDLTPNYLSQACEASLRRLQTDWIDIYQLHAGDCPLERLPDLIVKLDALVESGKIRSYGWSTDDADRAAAIFSQSAASVVQFQLNVLTDNPSMVSLIEKDKKMGLIRGPLAMGLLSGKYAVRKASDIDDVRNRTPPWMKYFKEGAPSPEYQARFERIREALRNGGRSCVQGALAWLWARSGAVTPIPGFRTPDQVNELAAALEFGPFAPAQMKEFEELLATE
jgi:aryl-alcohol dehydrogenase-like predicted oxidoreductase